MTNLIKKSICLLAFFMGMNAAQAQEMKQFNVVWTTQSDNSSGSMPLGGGDIGCNVWVEEGDVMLYLSQSGTFDENNTMLKLGRIRIHLPNNRLDKDFRQELKLEDGSISISGNGTQMKLWVEVFRPIVHIEMNHQKAQACTVSFESWRTADRSLDMNERHECFGYSNTTPDKIPVYTRADTFVPQANTFCWYHQNRNDELITDRESIHQHLGNYLDRLWDPLKDLVFGGAVIGEGLKYKGQHQGSYMDTPFTAWDYQARKATSQHIGIVLLNDYAKDISQWTAKLNRLAAAAKPTTALWQENQQWWSQFWNRSYIFINNDKPESDGWRIARNYQLFRYQLACNAYGKWPTKFNGSLFTFDPGIVNKMYQGKATPDFRRWGGGSFTAQNQRLVYWPMLKSGDFDMMPPQFDYYKNALGNAELRTRLYWGHEGASFSEQVNNNGLPAGHTYERLLGGTSMPIQVRTDKASTRTLVNQKGDTLRIIDHGAITNAWVSDHYDGQLEFAKMMLDYHVYSGNDISQYLPFIDSSLRFFDQHYQYWSRRLNGYALNADGKLIMYPGSCLETYKDVTNPVNTVAAMKSILMQLLQQTQCGTDQQRTYWQQLLGRLPELPLRERNGKLTFAPGSQYRPKPINNELPQMYPVFPYHLYGIGMPHLQLAIDTWRYGADSKSQFTTPTSAWNQDAIFTADMGLTDEAKKLINMKLSNSNRFRFPTFWASGDWAPDHNWGGVAMIALQDMLLQTANGKIYLIPAWPDDWNAQIKLHADRQTVVEATIRNGKVEHLKVTPAERLQDIVVMQK